MSITLRQLEIFIAVAETAQVTKASKKLFVTQSAVSMALAELENQLGGSLFDRHGRSLILNARGRYLLPLAKDIIAQVGSIETTGRAFALQVVGDLAYVVADGGLQLAHELVELPRARFDALLEGVLDQLPPGVHRVLDEIPLIVEDYRQAALRAKAAGFDGVEIHGANGYLIDQFIRSKSNLRSDAYGGSIENRIRFPMMVVDAVVGVWGGQRTGIRLSPTGTFNDMHDDDPVATYGALASHLNESGIAFIEVVEDSFQGNEMEGRPESVINAIRSGFTGAYIGNGNYTVDEARSRINAGLCDLVSFGRPFISNPDLPERFRQGAALNEYDSNTFYGGDEHGYIDYPVLE